MAYVVARPKGRFEIRESRATPRGPRARTLATFTVLDREVLGRAAARAETRIDAETIRARARALGAEVRDTATADAPAIELLGRLRHGAVLGRATRRMLLDRLGGRPAFAPIPTLRNPHPRDVDSVGNYLPASLEPMLDWVHTSDFERARVLIDLLDLGDGLPPRAKRRELAYPRICSD